MNESAAQAQYSVHDGDAMRDRDKLLAIWRGSLGDEARMAAKYPWFYLHDPSAPPLLKLLRHERDDVWAGACSIGHRLMVRRGREIRAGLLVDFAVHAGHRTLGPALALQRAMSVSAQEHFELVYGFPNRKAIAIFKRLGWRRITDMVRYTRVLRHDTYLGRHLPGIAARPAAMIIDTGHRLRDILRRGPYQSLVATWNDRVDPRMDRLWNQAHRDDALVSVRDTAWLRWRFDDCPLTTTRYLLLCGADDELVAWFATQVDGRTLHIRDCWSIDGSDGIARNHVDSLLGAARAAGYVAVSVEIAAAPSRTAGWRSRGFVERGRRPVYGATNGVEDISGNAYLTAADEDE